MNSVDILERVDVESSEKNDENLAHYAEAASVTESYVMGTPVTALCGKVFIPFRDPEKLKICPICKEIVEAVFFFS